MKIFSIYDSASETYSNPSYMQTIGVAERGFKDIITSDNASEISRHPEHFSLFHLGEFDRSTGQFKILKAPQLVINAWELK